MIKRLGKAKKSKQGALLIFVVLILALAIIFISAAMMLTNATRSRLYESTMTTQARLTCTSAVEVFLEALETQEITDEQLGGNIKTGHGGQLIRMVVEGVPGMSATGTDNCTFLDLYYPNHPDHKIVNADFTTTIGDETESIRVVLTVDSSGPNYGNRFKNQIEVDSDVQTETMRFFFGEGMTDPSQPQPTDNTILLRGHATDSAGGGVFYSDVVFAPGEESHWGSNNRFEGNTIFLNGATFYSSHDMVHYSGDIYFIGATGGSAAGFLYKGGDAANEYKTTNFSNSRFVFLNRSAQVSTEDTLKDDGEHIERVLKGLPDGGNISEVTPVSTKYCYFVTEDTDAANMGEEENPNRIVFKSSGSNITGTRQHTNSLTSYNIDNAWASSIDYSNPSADMIEVNDNLRRYSASDFCNVNKTFPDVVEKVFCDFSPDGYETAGPGGVTLQYDTYLKNGTVVPAGTAIAAGTEYEATPLTARFPSWLRTGHTADGAIPDTYKLALTTTALNQKASQQGHSGYVYLAPGYYYFTSGSTEYQSGTDPFVITIDGSHASSYRFYFAENTTFNLGTLVFAVYNVSDDTTPIVFIMEPGARINFGGANYREEGNICNAGFISVQHVDADGNALYEGNDNGASMASWIRSNAYTSELSDWGGGYYTQKLSNVTYTIEYPYAYDGVRRPTVYMFGAGNNILQIGDRNMIEAYIGLYGSGSTFGFNNCNQESVPIYIYGRIETNNYGISGSTGSPGGLCMPYCPQPGGVEESEKQTGLAKSKYSVADLIYYRVLPST